MRHSLPKFFTLTFAATWICWTASVAIARDNGSAAIAGALFLLGTFAPALVALALTDRIEGRAATRALLRRVFEWRVDAKWYVFAVGYMPVIKLSIALVHRFATGGWPRFSQEPWYLLVAAIVVSTWVQAGEEIGWRGYALPRLTDRFGLAPASVILGIFWASWHVPLFLAPEGDLFGQSFPLYVLQVTAVSVAMAWLYWRTKGSLLLVMLPHAVVNNTPRIIPADVADGTSPWAISTSFVTWLGVAFLWIVAAYFLVRMPKTATLP